MWTLTRTIIFCVAVLIGIPLSSAASMGQGSVDTKAWFDIPSDKAGLAVFADDSATAYQLSDAKQPLDAVVGKEGVPLLRQYRLPPGTYSIDVGGDVRQVNLAPGDLTILYLNVGDESAFYDAMQRGVRDALTSGLGKMTAAGQDTEPLYVQPQGNTLHFNTEPPFPIPKPKPTEPDPK